MQQCIRTARHQDNGATVHQGNKDNCATMNNATVHQGNKGNGAIVHQGNRTTVQNGNKALWQRCYNASGQQCNGARDEALTICQTCSSTRAISFLTCNMVQKYYALNAIRKSLHTIEGRAWERTYRLGNSRPNQHEK